MDGTFFPDKHYSIPLGSLFHSPNACGNGSFEKHHVRNLFPLYSMPCHDARIKMTKLANDASV